VNARASDWMFLAVKVMVNVEEEDLVAIMHGIIRIIVSMIIMANKSKLALRNFELHLNKIYLLLTSRIFITYFFFTNSINYPVCFFLQLLILPH